MGALLQHRPHIGQPKTETGRGPLQHLWFPHGARSLLKLEAGLTNAETQKPGLAGCGSRGDESYGPGEVGSLGFKMLIFTFA